MVRRSPSPEERQRDAERTKALILEAGTKEFASKGFAGARVSQIADRAGVNKQLISYYFGGKEGLYRAISDRFSQQESDSVLGGEDLFATLRRYFESAVHDPQAMKLLAWNGLSYREDGDVEDAAGVRPELLEVLRGLQESTVFDERLDPRFMTLMLVAAIGAPATYPQVVRGLCGMDATDEEFREKYLEQLTLMSEMVMRKGD